MKDRIGLARAGDAGALSRCIAALSLAAAGLVGGAAGTAAQASSVDVADVDAVFAEFDGDDNPGCAVGVMENGHIVLERAYGMANLEHDVPNTTETIFEPGSVAKQFTAAATILLALDGEISLDDDVRDYIPELPAYDTPVTIRHLLNHTSGLRDWGSIAGIAGWPRTTRVHTHEHMLDIASRQLSLNYPAGEYYSYTNTGYNLQAVLVERVSGMSFAEFSKTRIFEPLGMTRTEWRDDFQRVVKGRSTAYRPDGDGAWRSLMPFENVHGNGGLLTTVGDLLRFTRNLDTGELGGPAFIEEMHRQGVLNSGKTIAYASGLFVGEYKGIREVQHSGGTAAYVGFLTRFPDHGLAVSIMCNAVTGSPGRRAHEVADLYLGDAIASSDAAPDAPAGAISLPADRVEALAGTYRDTRTGAAVAVEAQEGVLQVQGTPLTPVSNVRFENPAGVELEFEAEVFADGRPAATMSTPVADGVRLEPVAEFDPGDEGLLDYVGAYHSPEAEVTYEIRLVDGRLALRDRYGNGGSLAPAYEDAFRAGGLSMIFRRDGRGRVTGASMSNSRVWSLRFDRVP